MKYNVTKDDGEPVSITVFLPGSSRPMVATKQHPNFDSIITELATGKPRANVVESLFDVTTTVESRLEQLKRRFLGKKRTATQARIERLTDKITVRNGIIHYEDKPVHDELAGVIAHYYSTGNDDFLPMALFMEKLFANPNKHSQEQLFAWLKARDFAITEDGCFLAYKVVRPDHKSHTKGNGGYVNGRKVDWIDNQVGNVIEMPREQVVHDPRQHCAQGLHVGTWSYIEWFRKGASDRVLGVKVDPRDVISVPNDHQSTKIRVCRYLVEEEVKAKGAFSTYK